MHAQRFRPLGGDQSPLPAHMIFVRNVRKLLLIEICAALQPFDSLFDGAAEARTDLETIGGKTL